MKTIEITPGSDSLLCIPTHSPLSRCLRYHKGNLPTDAPGTHLCGPGCCWFLLGLMADLVSGQLPLGIHDPETQLLIQLWSRPRKCTRQLHCSL